MNKYAEHIKEQNLALYHNQLSEQPYYNSMRGMYILAWIMVFICQVVSSISEYNYFLNTLLIEGIALYIASAILALSIEGIKFFLFSAFLSNLFRIKGKANFNIVLCFFVACLSAISITASIVGGGQLGIDKQAIPNIESKYNEQISILRNEIEDIKKRNTWKGNVYIVGKEKSLLYKKEEEITKLKQDYEKERQQLTLKNEEKEMKYRYGFAAFEITYIIFSFFIFYYKKRSVIEELNIPNAPNNYSFVPSQSGERQKLVKNERKFRIIPEVVKQPVKQPLTTEVEQPLTKVEQPINEQLPERFYEKICANPDCKKGFVTKYSNQVYCSKTCQREFNEKKLKK